ncbi:GntR family transcriptional regulator [Niallia alba]|uniref:GntR family transcriptional regulator n=1 Tax=Niallia alba TaxID=2729105 RepID=A0A7Y0K7Z9_9BACI|nr:GntR family transcriptional regulator [Niallia alba]NMO76839.1 GntR family transcriptional regulator [Niallia alba]
MIIKDSHIPIYYQLEMEIKEIIKELKPGDPISSEREFSEKYGISRMTVRQAINNLVAEGVLVRQRGKGTFVAAPKVEQELSGLTGFSEDMRSRGLTPKTKILDFKTIPCSRGIATKLKIEEGELVYEVSRLRIADEIPMALETSYLPTALVKELQEETLHGSIYEYVEQNLHLKISHATQTIESTLSQKNESTSLGIKDGAPVLLMERFSYLENGTPFEYVKSIYRGDRYKFVIDMKRSES